MELPLDGGCSRPSRVDHNRNRHLWPSSKRDYHGERPLIRVSKRHTPLWNELEKDLFPHVWRNSDRKYHKTDIMDWIIEHAMPRINALREEVAAASCSKVAAANCDEVAAPNRDEVAAESPDEVAAVSLDEVAAESRDKVATSRDEVPAARDVVLSNETTEKRMQTENPWTRYHGSGQGAVVHVEVDGDYCKAPRRPTLSELMTNKDFIDEMTCTICLEILVDATVLAPCGHVFCDGCVQQLCTNHQNVQQCPNCKMRFAKGGALAPALVVRNMIAKMDVRCQYGMSFNTQADLFENAKHSEEIICRAVLKVASRDAHERTCAFAPRACKGRTSGCRFVGILSDADRHEATCDYCTKSCCYCSAEVPARNLEQHMKLDCPKQAIPCLNAKHGCSVSPQRDSMKAHLSLCPFEKLRSFFERKDAVNLELQQQVEKLMKRESASISSTLPHAKKQCLSGAKVQEASDSEFNDWGKIS